MLDQLIRAGILLLVASVVLKVVRLYIREASDAGQPWARFRRAMRQKAEGGGWSDARVVRELLPSAAPLGASSHRAVISTD